METHLQNVPGPQNQQKVLTFGTDFGHYGLLWFSRCFENGFWSPSWGEEQASFPDAELHRASAAHHLPSYQLFHRDRWNYGTPPKSIASALFTLKHNDPHTTPAQHPFLLRHSQEQYPVARNDAKLLSRELAPSPVSNNNRFSDSFLSFPFPNFSLFFPPQKGAKKHPDVFPGFRPPMRPTSLYPLVGAPRFG